MKRSFPPMPPDPLRKEYRVREISSYQIGNIYKTESGETLYVIGSFLFYKDDNISGYVQFRNKADELVQKDVSDLKTLQLKLIFGREF